MKDHWVAGEGVRCPSCQTVLDGALNTTGVDGPEAGNVSICAYCAEVCVFVEEFLGPDGGGLLLRSATSVELRELGRVPEFVRARWAVLELIARRQ